MCEKKEVLTRKGLIILAPAGGVLADFWVPNEIDIELVSKELNHFGVIADLFRQIGGHSSRFVLFFSF